jgi:hypothetical protein
MGKMGKKISVNSTSFAIFGGKFRQIFDFFFKIGKRNRGGGGGGCLMRRKTPFICMSQIRGFFLSFLFKKKFLFFPKFGDFFPSNFYT